MKFVLRVESPLHVGTGEILSWLDYQLESKTIHVLDWTRLMTEIRAHGDDAISKFATWSDRAAKIVDDAAEQTQKLPPRERADVLRKARDESAVSRFAKQELGDDALAKRIRDGEFDRYSLDYVGGRLDRRLEIRTTAKDAKGQAIVPGSTLRGQIRSALLHAALAASPGDLTKLVMQGSRDAEGWARSLEDATPGRSRYLFGDALERALLRPGSRLDDPRFDLMRFVRVSEPTRARTKLVGVRSSPFLVGKDKMVPLAPLVCEAIDVGSEIEFELGADAALAKGAACADGGTHALVSDEFWALFARVFGVTRDEAKALEVRALEERMLSAIEVSLASRYAAIARREKAWFDRAGAPSDAPLRKFADALAESTDRIPLRLGMGSGLHVQTLLLGVESSAELAEPFARAIARVGLGLDPRKRRERAEREKQAIEKARAEAKGKGGEARLRHELVAESRDPKQLPVVRHFTMDGPLPDLFFGCSTLARGEMGEAAVAPESTLAFKIRSLRRPSDDAHDQERGPRREERRDDRGPRRDDRGPRRDDRRDDRPGDRRDDRGPRRDDRGPRRDDRGPRRDDRGSRHEPPRKNLPDRPATNDEIADLLKRFGRR